MKKLYNFWLLPYSNFCQNENLPYSSMNGSIITAKQWAENLLKINAYANEVVFKSENGRKEYRTIRGQEND